VAWLIECCQPVPVSPTHHGIAGIIAGELAERDDVLAVLIVGSLARGEELDISDVDLLTVCTGENRDGPKPRTLRDGYLVEIWAKTEAAWAERFRSTRPMWIYAFLEADVVYDTGPASRLRSAAQRAYDEYRTPEDVRQELAASLSHGQPKLRRALRASGEHAGYWASVLLPEILDGLYAVYDRPRPPGSRRLDLLHTLPLSGEERHRVTLSCTGSPEQRLKAIAVLYETLTQRLGPPDLELV
jgi:predicted nucleotidyltransferase